MPASSWSPPPATSGRARRARRSTAGITAPGQRAVGADGRRVAATWARSIATMTPSRRSARAARAQSIAPTKPDLVAPGVGIESLSGPGQRAVCHAAPTRASGDGSDSQQPYLSLSGTSMAAPVVDRHRRADAAGEPGAVARGREGDSAIDRSFERQVRCLHSGRRLPGRTCRSGAGPASSTASPGTSAGRCDGSGRHDLQPTMPAANCARQLRRFAAASTASALVADGGTAAREPAPYWIEPL